MPEEIFRSGTLELSTAPVLPEPVTLSWIDNEVNCILVVVSVLLMILNMRGFLWVFPNISRSILRERACLNLEHSVSMARSRDLTAIVLLLPFCLIFDRYSVLMHFLRWNLPWWAGTIAVFCFLLVYVGVRRALCVCLKPRRMDYDYSNALYKTIYSFFIVLCLLLLLSTGIFEFFNFSDTSARMVILCEFGLVYAFSLVKTIQFLSAYCNGLLTFLYLCVLEFVPVAAAVVPCIFLSL